MPGRRLIEDAYARVNAMWKTQGRQPPWRYVHYLPHSRALSLGLELSEIDRIIARCDSFSLAAATVGGGEFSFAGLRAAIIWQQTHWPYFNPPNHLAKLPNRTQNSRRHGGATKSQSKQRPATMPGQQKRRTEGR